MRALLTLGSLAQLVEHRAFNPLVLGSSPRRPTSALSMRGVPPRAPRLKALPLGASTFLTQTVLRYGCRIVPTGGSPWERS